VTNSFSSTSCELKAIKLALENCETNNINNVTIFTDSKVSCQILKNNTKEKESEEMMNAILTKLSKVQGNIQWIPSHIGINGNEKADELAKKGCDEDIYICEIETVRDSQIQIFNFINNSWNNWYQEQVRKGKGIKASNFYENIENKPWYFKCKQVLKGADIKTINRLIAGHDLTPKYLKIMKLIDSDLCEKCNVICDALHVLKDCTKYTDRKFQINSNIQNLLKNASENELKNIWEFINANEIAI
jgi:ribonuclease HI